MKLVFAHDHKLRKINNKFYTTGGLSDNITSHYTKYFNELTIFCRVIDKQPYDTNLFEIRNPSVIVKAVSHGPLILSSNAKKMMEKEIKEADALIVKLHSLIAEQAIKYARKYNVPYLVEVVGDPWDAYWNHGIIGKLIAPRMTWSTRKEIKRAPFAMYVTKEYLEKKYPCNGKWIGCSDVELQDVDSRFLEKRISKIKNKTENNPIILGTLAQVDVPYKGQEYVIKAISVLKSKGKKFKYRMAGMGNPDRLKKIAQKYGVLNQIEFDGVLSHSDVFKWLDDIDIYIQPSKQEGLPRSVVEALSRACPTYGSMTGGIPELIQKGYLFKPGKVSQIVTLLENIDSNTLEKQAKKNFDMSKNYRKDVLDKKRDSFYGIFYDYVKSQKNR